MDLDFVRIAIEITAKSPSPLTTALYSVLRNFEAEFRSACCDTPQRVCGACRIHDLCPYRVVFKQQLSSDPEIVRRHQKPSLPFSLYVDGAEDHVLSCSAGLVVIGSAVNFIGYFYTALLRVVTSGLGTLPDPDPVSFRSYSLDYHGVRHEISHDVSMNDSVILLSGQHLLDNTVHGNAVRVTLFSPLHLIINGAVSYQFDFARFFRSQLRRCSSLCAYYGVGELDLDYAGLSDAAQNVAVIANKIHYIQPAWSNRRNRAGLIGTAECTGLVEPMVALLLLGSCFNGGKGASYGSGFHHVEVI